MALLDCSSSSSGGSSSASQRRSSLLHQQPRRRRSGGGGDGPSDDRNTSAPRQRPPQRRMTRKVCTRCARRKVHCDLAIPCGTCVRLGLSHVCRQHNDKAGSSEGNAVAIVDVPAPVFAAVAAPSTQTSMSVRVLVSTDDALAALECYGNVELASRWTAMDKQVLEQLKTALRNRTHGGGIHGLSDLELAFTYGILATCCHTIPFKHAYRRTGGMLDRFMLRQYTAEAERFLALHHEQEGEKTTSPLVCRLHHLLVWVHIHARRFKRACHHLRRAVDVGHETGLYTSQHAALTPQQELDRLEFAFELDSADGWLCITTGMKTCVPAMPTDVAQFADSLVASTPIHSRAWHQWLVHASKWARRTATFVSESGRPHQQIRPEDNEDEDINQTNYAIASVGFVKPHAERCEQALALLSEMEYEEQYIFCGGHFPPALAVHCSDANDDEDGDDYHNDGDDAAAAASQMREVSVSVHYATFCLKALLTGGALDAELLNLPLCSVALNTAHDILIGVPSVLHHARSPWASLFTIDWVSTIIDVGAGIVYSALNRVHDMPTAHLQHSVDRLIYAYPGTFDMLNAYGAASAMELQVATMIMPLAVPRPLPSISTVVRAEGAASKRGSGTAKTTTRFWEVPPPPS